MIKTTIRLEYFMNFRNDRFPFFKQKSKSPPVFHDFKITNVGPHQNSQFVVHLNGCFFDNYRIQRGNGFKKITYKIAAICAFGHLNFRRVRSLSDSVFVNELRHETDKTKNKTTASIENL